MALRSSLAAAFFIAFSPLPGERAHADDFGDRLAAAAMARTALHVRYDGAYVALDYPGGDPPADGGVCSDVVVRALRALGVDLQVLVHEDMEAAFASYPDRWGAAGPDPNIDHRRVPNLETFFTRAGARLETTDQGMDATMDDFAPGDIVAWNLRGRAGGALPHIGIVAAARAPSGRPLVVHNIGAGPKAEDVLFNWPITGHYRFRPTPD